MKIRIGVCLKKNPVEAYFLLHDERDEGIWVELGNVLHFDAKRQGQGTAGHEAPNVEEWEER